MRVLLVEDEIPLAQIVAESLAEANIDVDLEHDGPSGLWRATEGSYDVIVLDIMLPGMNGYELCRRLRETDVWTPILMLTAKNGEHDEAEALNTGADDYLRKPFSFVVLTARLHALARREVRPRPVSLTVGPLTVDPATATATRDGVNIALTRRELAVLEMLIRSAETPLPTSRILDHVWGFDTPESNVVQVTIRALRRKIDEPFDEPLIETVRNAGYRLVMSTERAR